MNPETVPFLMADECIRIAYFLENTHEEYKQEKSDNNNLEVKYMFRNTRKKQLRNRVIAAAAGVCVMTFGIWLNYQDDGEEIPAEDAAKNVKIEQDDSKSHKTEKSSDKDMDKGTGTSESPETYLIKEVDGVVKVFLCDKDGSEELYLITSIPFELLSESDQQLFIDGVSLDTEEDLGKFLENFDS